jgi:CheY-like chemotaxis protein
MDGYEVARRLRLGAPAGLVVIGVSGYGQPRDVERAREAGFDHHIVKPPDPDTLRRLLG